MWTYCGRFATNSRFMEPSDLARDTAVSRLKVFASSLDLTVHFLDDTTSQWMLTLVHARRARAGYASADAEIWDDRGHLVALATQTMLLRRAPGPLPFTE